MHASPEPQPVQAFELTTANLAAAPTGALCIHTERLSLKLDGKGICQEVFTLDGSKPANLQRFVGAQFVASLHPDFSLAPQPRVGSHALLIDRGEDAAQPAGTSPSLIRTARITGVIYDHDLIDDQN